jgi:protein-disulfide isomerase-like protein with CxxC motif
VGVNTDDDADDYREKLESFGVSWVNAWQGSELCQKFGVNSFPTIAVLDEDGRVAVMDARGAGLETAVERVLADLKQRQAERDEAQ